MKDHLFHTVFCYLILLGLMAGLVFCDREDITTIPPTVQVTVNPDSGFTTDYFEFDLAGTHSAGAQPE